MFAKTTAEQYKAWQEQLKASQRYRWLVVFAGIYSILLFVPLGLYLLTRPQGVRLVILCLVALAVARGLVTELITFLYKKQRPYQVYTFDAVSSWLFSRRTMRENSFPSGHTVSVVAISTVLVWYYPAFGILGYVLALLVGYGRVRLGNHFPVDILGGFLVGLSFGYVVVRFFSPILLPG